MDTKNENQDDKVTLSDTSKVMIFTSGVIVMMGIAIFVGWRIKVTKKPE